MKKEYKKYPEGYKEKIMYHADSVSKCAAEGDWDKMYKHAFSLKWFLKRHEEQGFIKKDQWA